MRSSVARLLLIGIFIQCGVLLYVYNGAHNSRVNQIEAQRKGCERSKQDRRDNADFQRAMSTYNKKIAKLLPDSKLKQASEDAQLVFARTSRGLTRRARINCQEAFK